MPKRSSMRAIPSGVIASELKAITFGSQTSIDDASIFRNSASR